MFIKLLNEATVAREKRKREEEKKQSKPTDLAWRSSGLGTCMRGRFIQRLAPQLGLEPLHDPRTLNVFEIGNQVEHWLVETLKSDPTFLERFDVYTQGELYNPTYHIRGHLDLLVREKSTGKLTILECKSKHSKAFWYMEKKGEGANIHHKMQLHSYLYMLHQNGAMVQGGKGVIHPGTLSEGAIVYVSKDDMAMLEYPVLLNDTELEKMWKFDVQTLQDAWEQRKAPPAPDPTSWQCKYCQFCQMGICGELTDEKVDQLMTLAGYPPPAPVTQFSPEIVSPF